MTTVGPTLDATGFYVPNYADIFTQLQSGYLAIYGADSVLTPDTQDGQFLAIFAKAISDCENAALAVYNSFNLNGAQGAGLSSLVKLVGVRRAASGFSTDTVTLAGTAGQTITNGQVGDDQGQGTIWNLPASVTFPGGGTINVTVTNTVAGTTTFEPGQLNVILTPQLGWQSAVNIGPAVAGAAVQTDAALRETATASVGGPASTVLAAINAAIANVANVTRFFVYENDTDVNDGNGQGPHSIYAVIQGGAAQDIANAIGSTKSPGTTTLGTSSAIFVDQNGVPNTINYYVLTPVVITVIVNVAKLPGWTTLSNTLIQQAIAEYLSGLAIGEDSYLNRLFAPAALSGDAATTATGYTQAALDAISATYHVTSIEQSRPSNAPPAVQDVLIAFNEAAVCATANITVNAV